ncbi:MAG: diacylglycerol/lipid kinase family protein [Fimbriimonas sp.]
MFEGSYAVVINPKSRLGTEASATLRPRLEPEAEFFRLVTSVGAFDRAMEEAVNRKIQTVFVGGGDGTIRQAARHLVGTETTLGILPFGTGNSLARELGIPLALDMVVPFFREVAHVRKIDVGTFNGEVFVNVATLGLTSRIASALKVLPKSQLGRWAYLPALVAAASLTRSQRIVVETNSGVFEGQALQMVAASTRLHSGPFAVTKNAAIDDGKLSIYVLEKGDRAALLEFGLALLVGRHCDLPNVWAVDVAEATVTLGRPSKFVLDGDPFRAQKVALGVRAGALKVLAE